MLILIKAKLPNVSWTGKLMSFSPATTVGLCMFIIMSHAAKSLSRVLKCIFSGEDADLLKRK